VSEDLDGMQCDLPPYVTLSYCWGDRGNYWTTSSNILERMKEIVMDDLPGTIRDAVLITRELGLRYLWVDALCILQGLKDEAAQLDWQQHSAIMGDIYGNAFVTIAAAAAPHADSGIFHERVLPRYCQVPFSTGHQEEFMDLCSDENRDCREEQPLSKRSWALQETILSRRVISYETGQIVWKCAEFMIREDGTGVPHYSSLLAAYTPETWASTWRRFVKTYSETKSTLEKDKLPALSGLVKVLQHSNRDEYLAGLWKNTLCDDLLWKYTDPRKVRRPSRYRAPSWSWAALDGKVGWLSDIFGLFCDELEKPLVQTLVQLLDKDIAHTGPDTFGEVSHAVLSIHGTLKTLGKNDFLNKSVEGNNMRLERIFPDMVDDFVQCEGKLVCKSTPPELFAFPIKSGHGVYIGLLLSYNNINKLSYRRVGMFMIRPKDNRFWLDGCIEQTIRIE
jgi:hypothetical protein